MGSHDWAWHAGWVQNHNINTERCQSYVLTQYFDIDAIQILLVRSVAQIVFFGMVAKLRGLRDETCPHRSQKIFSVVKVLFISASFPTGRWMVLYYRRLLPSDFSTCLFVFAQMMLSGITLYLGFR